MDKKIYIQKTHYEVVKDLINNRGLINCNFNEFARAVEAACGKTPDFQQFTKVPLLQDMAATVGPSDISQLTTFANILHHLYLMHQYHDRIYYICPNLAVNLARTDLNVDTYFLKAPFPEMYIQIDPGLYYITDPIDPKQEHPVRGFYVNLKEENGIKQVRIMVAALSSNYSEISEKNDDALFYFKIFLGEGKIKDELDKYLESEINNRHDELRVYGGLYNIDHLKELFFFVFNALLYMTSRDADIINQLPVNFNQKIEGLKNKSKIRKALKRQTKTCGLPIIIMGSKVLSLHTLDQIKTAGGIGRWKLGTRVYVSGHWRAQWFGSEKEDSRRQELIFIEPYEKGPEMADMINKRYQVK